MTIVNFPYSPLHKRKRIPIQVLDPVSLCCYLDFSPLAFADHRPDHQERGRDWDQRIQWKTGGRAHGHRLLQPAAPTERDSPPASPAEPRRCWRRPQLRIGRAPDRCVCTNAPATAVVRCRHEQRFQRWCQRRHTQPHGRSRPQPDEAQVSFILFLLLIRTRSRTPNLFVIFFSYLLLTQKIVFD